MDMFDIEGETVKLYGKTIGKFNEEKIQTLLKQAGCDTWTRKLRAYIDNMYIDYDVCPHCAGTNFRRYREVSDHIIAGFCADCKADLVAIDGRLEDLRSGKTGVLQSHSRLYYTMEEVVE